MISSPGRNPWSPHLASPPGFHLLLALNWPYPLIAGTKWNEWLWILFQRPQLVGGGLSVTLGVPWHLSITESVSCYLYNPFRALLPHQPQGLEDVEKICSDVAFLLALTEDGPAGDRVHGLALIWVNPYQARVSTVEEAVKQLTALVSTGSDWPYALLRLNRDVCHVPLPREGTWASWW